MSQWSDPDKKLQGFMVNKAVLLKLKAYALETEQTLETVIKGPYERFEQELLELSRQIDSIRQAAVLEEASKKSQSIVPMLE